MERLAERFELEEFRETRIVPRFNIAPSQEIAAIVATESGRALRLMR